MYPQNLGYAEDEFFCYSFLEQVISDLQKIDKIRTPSISEISRYKNNDQPPSEIALKLGVSNIAQLSIINTEDKFQINKYSCKIIDSNSIDQKTLLMTKEDSNIIGNSFIV